MATLLVQFEHDRTQVGVIKLLDHSGKVVRFYSALGKAANNDASAHGNPTALPIFKYGDTPSGVYKVTAIVKSGFGTIYSNVHSYGDVGVIQLDPFSGQAQLAKQNGRQGLLIHGGTLGGSHLLRRTNGCIRMMNGELADLIEQVNRLSENLEQVEVSEVSTVGTGPCDGSDSCDEIDPPPM